MRFLADGILAVALIAATAPALAAGTTTRASVSSSGIQATGDSADPAVSADGRYVAFISAAGNLVAHDNNGMKDVFVRDRQLGRTERVSISSSGAEGNGDSGHFGEAYGKPVAISADGSLVAFTSLANNLVKGDTNQKVDVFVRDRQNKTTTRVSVAMGGAQAQGQSTSMTMSSDGRYVAFQSDAANLFTGDANATYDVFVRDRLNGTTRHVSRSSGGIPGDAASILPAISANGRFVAFASLAKNLVPGNSNSLYDVFVRDLSGGKTSRVSVATGGVQGDRASGLEELAISGDGSYVAFTSDAKQLVVGDNNFDTDVFVRNRVAGTTSRVSLAAGGLEADGFSFHPAISADRPLRRFRLVG